MIVEIQIPDGEFCGDCQLRSRNEDISDLCNFTGDELHHISHEAWDKVCKAPSCPNYKESN
jgi:hypothetical protein